MIWLQVGIATLTGWVIGFWGGMEIGRLIYNRKMDEIRDQVEEMRELLRRAEASV